MRWIIPSVLIILHFLDFLQLVLQVFQKNIASVGQCPRIFIDLTIAIIVLNPIGSFFLTIPIELPDPIFKSGD